MKEFQKAISTAKMRMLRYKTLGFFAYLLFNLKIIKDTEIESMKTNGIDIFINPDWFTDLNNDMQVYSLLHITIHIALQHPSRMQNRDPQLWMAASDYITNLTIQDYGLAIPQDALCDIQFKGKTTEKVYEILLENKKNDQDQPQPDHDDLLKPPVNNPNSSDSNNNSGSDGNNDSPQNDNQESAPSSFKDMQDFQDKMEDLLNNAKTQAKMGNNFSTDGLPEEMQRLLAEMEKPVLPWQKILARFLNQTAKNNYTWINPNRRFLPMDIYLPSMTSEGLERVDFIIDTSGSISDKEFNQFVSEVDKVLKEYKPKEIGVSQFDHLYRGTELVDSTTDIRKIEFKGGGGTEITKTLETVSKMPTKCVIIFTDGYLQVDKLPKPPMPVVWAIYDNDNFKEPFGKQIKFELDR